MLSTTTEFRKTVSGFGATAPKFTAKCNVTLADATELLIEDKDIIVGGLTIDDDISSGQSFPIGGAVINQLTLSINNIEGDFNNYDFANAEITAWVGLVLPNGTEWLKKGIYKVDECTLSNSVITLTALDRMVLFDRPFIDVNPTVWGSWAPNTVITQMCLALGISWYFPTSAANVIWNKIIPRLPNGYDSMTCRQVLSYMCQMCCLNARFDVDGFLILHDAINLGYEPNTIDGGYFDTSNPYSSGVSIDGGDFNYNETTQYDGGDFTSTSNYHLITRFKSISVATDNTSVDGVSVKAFGTTSDYGETSLLPPGAQGLIYYIDDNPFIVENTSADICLNLSENLVLPNLGRKFECDILGNPSIESGDAVILYHNENLYVGMITSTSFNISNGQTIKYDIPIAESGKKSSSTELAQGIAQSIVADAKGETLNIAQLWDSYQKQISDTVINGLGLYTTTIPDEFETPITYTHDKTTMDLSTKRWFATSGGFLQQTRPTIFDEWVTTSGVDVYGNALYNVLTVKGLNAEWINVGVLRAIEINNGNGTFRVDTNGNMTATSGYIGGCNISVNGFSAYKQVYIMPTEIEMDLIRDFILGTKTPTSQQLLASDIVVNGAVSLADALAFRKILNGTASFNDYPLYTQPKSWVTTAINSNDPTRAFEVSGTNAWGRYKRSVLGIDGLDTDTIRCNSIRFTYNDADQYIGPYGNIYLPDTFSYWAVLRKTNSGDVEKFRVGYDGTITAQGEIFTAVGNIKTSAELNLLCNANGAHVRDYCTAGYIPITASAFVVASSKRYKDHVEYMTEEDANKLLNLEVAKFDYKNGEKGQYGLYAEDTVDLIPTCVHIKDEQVEGIDYSKLVPFLIKKLQMQERDIQKVNDDLQLATNELKSLREEVKILKGLVMNK